MDLCIYYLHHHIGGMFGSNQSLNIPLIQSSEFLGQPFPELYIPTSEGNFTQPHMAICLRTIVHNPMQMIQQVVVLGETDFNLFFLKTG